MNFRLSTYILACLLVILACGQDTDSDSSMTRRGYKVEHHVKNNGEVPSPGEYAYFQIVMRNKDSILNTSYLSDQIPRLQIPEADAITPETPIIVDALELMSEGDSVTLFYPLDSLPQVPPGFEDVEVIEYDIKLVEIKTADEFQAEMAVIMQEREMKMKEAQARYPEIQALGKEMLDKYNTGTLQGIQKTPEGLEYVIHQEGDGKIPVNGEMVAAHYYGTFMDGREFDTSFQMGRPYEFPLGQRQVIQGWDLGFALLKRGTQASFFIPPELAYGEQGYSSIPGNTQLYFLVELQ